MNIHTSGGAYAQFFSLRRWTRIDEDRLLLGDAFGRLSMLVLRRSQSDMLMIVPLGQVCFFYTLSQ